MKEYLKQFLPIEYIKNNWIIRRVKEPSSWNSLALLLLAGAVYFLVYPTVCIFLSAGCAFVAFILKDKNVN